MEKRRAKKTVTSAVAVNRKTILGVTVPTEDKSSESKICDLFKGCLNEKCRLTSFFNLTLYRKSCQTRTVFCGFQTEEFIL